MTDASQEWMTGAELRAYAISGPPAATDPLLALAAGAPDTSGAGDWMTGGG